MEPPIWQAVHRACLHFTAAHAVGLLAAHACCTAAHALGLLADGRAYMLLPLHRLTAAHALDVHGGLLFATAWA